MKAIAGGLGFCTNLEFLCLRYNRVELQAASHMAIAARRWHLLTEIDLTCTNLGAVEAKILFPSLKACISLRYLNCSVNAFGDLGTKAFGDTLCKPVGDVPTATGSESHESDVGDDSEHTFTTTTSSARFRIEQPGLLRPPFSALETVDFSATGIGDEGFKALAHGVETIANVRRLDLSCNAIGDAGIRGGIHSLAQCTALTHLNLSANIIRDPGATHISRAFADNQHLQFLSMSKNRVSYLAWGPFLTCQPNCQRFLCSRDVILR